MCSRQLAALILLAFPSIVCAQQVHVVAPGGAGAFTDIGAAIQAAQPGDAIVVRAGAYTSFTVDKGVRVLADPGVVLSEVRGSAITVDNVPAGQTAVVCGFAAPTLPFGLLIRVRNNAGHVHLENGWCGGLIGSSVIESCANVTLANVNFTTSLTITGSTVAMTRCQAKGEPVFLGTPGLAALNVSSSRVWFAEGTAIGGSDTTGFGLPATPAVVMDGSQLFVAGDGTTQLVAGTSLSTTPVAAIVGSGSQVVVDPAVLVAGSAGGGEHAGTGSYARASVPSQVATFTPPGQLDLLLRAPGAMRAHMLVSLVPAEPLVVGPPLGDWWLAWPHLVVDSGNVPPSGIRTVRLAVPPAFPGLPLMVQGVVLQSNGFIQLTAPAPVVVSR